MVRPLLLLFVAGCFPRLEGTPPGDEADADGDADSDADADADGDADSDADPPAITALSVTDGPTGGGTEVELQGSNFAESTHAWFGDAEAEVVELARERLLVRTPRGAAGTVDVSVGRAEPESRLRGAYTYWTDHSGDTDALVLWYYFSFSDGETGLYGTLWPLSPEPLEFWEYWGGQMDACDVASTRTLSSWDADVTLVSEGGDRYGFTLADGSYDYADESGTWSAGDTLGVEATGGTTTPDFETGPFFSTPASFRLTRPAVSDGDVLYLYPDDISVSWTGAGEDFVVLWLRGSSSEASLYCVVEDDGSFTIDGSYMSRFDYLEYVQFSAMRHRVGSVELAHDGGTLQGAGMYMVAGWLEVY